MQCYAGCTLLTHICPTWPARLSVAANKYTAVRWFCETSHRGVSPAALPPLWLQLLQHTVQWHYYSTPHPINSQVDSAFYAPWDGKMSTRAKGQVKLCDPLLSAWEVVTTMCYTDRRILYFPLIHDIAVQVLSMSCSPTQWLACMHLYGMVPLYEDAMQFQLPGLSNATCNQLRLDQIHVTATPSQHNIN